MKGGMRIFKKIKNNISTRQAAAFYGMRVDRRGMMSCPFHPDRNPSMKVDERYHCFGCGADGDVIDFVANLFHLKKGEAARKLAADFGISTGNHDAGIKKKKRKSKEIPEKRRHKRKETIRAREHEQLQRRFEIEAKRFFRTMTSYYHLLGDWQEQYAPSDPTEEWDERFCEALRTRTKLAYVLDCFLEGSMEEQLDIVSDYREEVHAYERALRGDVKRKDRIAERDADGVRKRSTG